MNREIIKWLLCVIITPIILSIAFIIASAIAFLFVEEPAIFIIICISLVIGTYTYFTIFH